MARRDTHAATLGLGRSAGQYGDGFVVNRAVIDCGQCPDRCACAILEDAQAAAVRHPKLIDAPAKGDTWLHEIKYDGYRTQLVVEDGEARAFTRNGHDWTDKYGPIVSAANTLPCTSAIIDGELIVQDENGVSDFAALRSAIYKAPHRLLFFAFDLLHLNGHDLRDMILEDRRELLADLIEDRDPRLIYG